MQPDSVHTMSQPGPVLHLQRDSRVLPQLHWPALLPLRRPQLHPVSESHDLPDLRHGQHVLPRPSHPSVLHPATTMRRQHQASHWSMWRREPWRRWWLFICLWDWDIMGLLTESDRRILQQRVLLPGWCLSDCHLHWEGRQLKPNLNPAWSVPSQIVLLGRCRLRCHVMVAQPGWSGQLFSI